VKVLQVIVQEGMLKGGTVAVDATTRRPTWAAFDRRDTGERWDVFLKRWRWSRGSSPRKSSGGTEQEAQKQGSNAIGRIRKTPTPKMKYWHPHLTHNAEQAVAAWRAGRTQLCPFVRDRRSAANALKATPEYS
jgi:hypothetical protein